MSETIVEQIAASSDDGYSRSDSVFSDNANFVLFGRGGGGVTFDAWFRFQGVAIPLKAKIISATIEFIADGNYGNTACVMKIHANDEDDAAAPVSRASHAGKSRTTAYADWTVTAWTSGQTYTSPEIRALIQEVVDRGGWVSGNDLMILLDDNGSSANALRQAESYDDTPGDSAVLRVEYSTFVPQVIFIGADR